jgi:hypothetical protein
MVHIVSFRMSVRLEYVTEYGRNMLASKSLVSALLECVIVKFVSFSMSGRLEFVMVKIVRFSMSRELVIDQKRFLAEYSVEN